MALRRLETELRARQSPFTLYEDLSDPRGIALLTWSEDPSDIVTRARPAVLADGLSGLRPRPELSMLGRTYATGFETDLRFWLLDRPRQTVVNPAWPWAIWRPLWSSTSGI